MSNFVILGKDNVFTNLEDAANAIQESMEERLNEVSYESTDSEYEEYVENATYIDAPDDSYYAVIGNNMYAADKRFFEERPDGSYKWNIPEEVRLTNVLGYYASPSQKTVSSEDIIRDYDRLYNRDISPEDMRKKVVESLTDIKNGKSASADFMLYDPAAARVENGCKQIGLPIEHVSGRPRFSYVEIKVDDPYDFKIKESALAGNGDPNKIFHVLALPDMPSSKRAGKITEFTKETDPRMMRLVCDMDSGYQGYLDAYNPGYRRFSYLADTTRKAVLANELFDHDSTVDSSYTKNNKSPEDCRKWLDSYENSKFETIDIPKEFCKSDSFDYYVPSQKGQYVMNLSGTGIEHMHAARVARLKFDLPDNPKSADFVKDIYFGKDGSKICFPANMPLNTDGYTIKDLKDDIHCFNSSSPTFKDGFGEAVAKVDRSRLVHIENSNKLEGSSERVYDANKSLEDFFPQQNINSDMSSPSI